MEEQKVPVDTRAVIGLLKTHLTSFVFIYSPLVCSFLDIDSFLPITWFGYYPIGIEGKWDNTLSKSTGLEYLQKHLKWSAMLW